jgi:hypothetical protein
MEYYIAEELDMVMSRKDKERVLEAIKKGQ